MPLPRPRPVSSRLAVAGLASLGLATLAGCAGPDEIDTSASYSDGEYHATGRYQSPAGASSVDVTLTLADDIVTAVSVTPHASDPQSLGFQTAFAGGIAAEVIGKDIDALSVSRVAGSSLTSGGFNAAVEAIKTEAIES